MRDITYDEDRSRVGTGHAGHVMATLRNLVISLHRPTGATNITHATRTAMRNPEIGRHITEL